MSLFPIMPPFKYSVGAVVADGTNDSASRGVQLDGAVDGKLFIFSCWLDFNGGNATLQYIVHFQGGTVNITKTTSNKISIVMWESASQVTKIFELISSTSITDASGWTHILAAGDAVNSIEQMYINDSADLATQSSNNTNVDYTVTNAAICATTGPANLLNADIAELYFNTAETIDLSATANRRKFVTSSVKPVNLGSDGSAPTGTAPIMFHRVSETETTANNIANNQGSGGNFSVITGPFTIAATSPSD